MAIPPNMSPNDPTDEIYWWYLNKKNYIKELFNIFEE